MRNSKIFIPLGILAAAIIFAFVTPHLQKLSQITLAYPDSVCPGLTSDGATAFLLPSSKIQIREIRPQSLRLKASKQANLKSTNNPILVAGNDSTSVAISSNAGHWLGSTLCSSSSGDQWFVGGDGGVTSTSKLEMVNSGLSNATVELTIYTGASAPAMVPVIVKANSARILSLDSLAPGQNSIVIHALARAGRITTFLFDERHKGLSPLGMDYVNPISETSKDLVIPAIINSAPTGIKWSASHFLRLLAPGDLDANIKVTIHSSDGDFIPLGFDQKSLAHKRVLDIPLASFLETKPFAIEVSSEQPIVAAIRTQISASGKIDFAWATPTPPLNLITLNLGGLTPMFVFHGDQIRIKAHWTFKSSGKSGTTKSDDATITANHIAYWRPNTGINQITLSSEGTVVTAGMIFYGSTSANFGLSYLPVQSGSRLESTSVPILDARVISRG
jgi:hypothetical protein